MDILHIDPNDASSDQRVNYLIDCYQKSDMQSTQQEIKATKLQIHEQEKDHHGYAQGFVNQVKLCTQRAYKDFIREPLKYVHWLEGANKPEFELCSAKLFSWLFLWA